MTDSSDQRYAVVAQPIYVEGGPISITGSRALLGAHVHGCKFPADPDANTAMAESLVEFLRARLDEDRQRVIRAGEGRVAWLTFRNSDGSMRYTTVAAEAGDGAWIADGEELLTEPASVDVIFDPSRVLAEVEAKRRIIDLAESWASQAERVERADARPDAVMLRTQAITAETIVRVLIQPYADHPDFDPAWRLA